MNDPPPHRLDVWEHREKSMWPALPYAMLAFSLVLTVLVELSERQSPLPELVLAGLAALWMLCLYTLVPGRRDRGLVQAVFFPGLVAIMTLMIIVTTWFGFFTWTGYLYAVKLPPGPRRLLGVAAVAILTGSSQAGGFATAGKGAAGLAVYLGCVLVNLAIGGGFTWFGWVAETQGERRVRMVAELSEANRRLEATLAENAGLHEQLLTQAREAGILDERQRMAREIHDTLAQGLAGIITQLHAAGRTQDPADQRRHYDATLRLARESLSEARRSVDELRPEPLERARLGTALVGVAERWSALHGIPAQVAMTGTARPLRPETEFTLLRTAQEALANVAKHAAAARVGLTLSYLDEAVILDVRDDGRGFDPARASREPAYAGELVPAGGPSRTADSSGFGLVAMRERIEGMAGTLQVESEPGAGTAISACVPDRPPGCGT